MGLLVQYVSKNIELKLTINVALAGLLAQASVYTLM
jgi:hypothetical protein